MAQIKNIVETRFTAQGAKSTANQTETLTRAQTRLAQSSASAGRVFSSQAKGLGGLVAAYAGAAATTYALQQAFSKLASAARSVQALEGLTGLAARTGQDAKKILANIDDITKGQIGLAKSTEALGIAISSGYSMKQITGLASVARASSAALGRDVTAAFERIVKGSSRMSVALLDDLGLFPRIDAATKAYATTLGKSAKSLNDFERRQAYVNAVIAEGERKFKSVSSAMPTASEQFQKLSATVKNMIDSFSEALVNAVMPFVEFVNKHGVAAMSSFAIMGSMVASKGLEVFKDSIEGLSASLSTLGANTENNIKRLRGIHQVAATATTSLRNLDVRSTGLSGDDASQFRALQSISKDRTLTNEELRLTEELLQKSAKIQEDMLATAKAEVVEAENKTKELRLQTEEATKQLTKLKTEELALKKSTELPDYKEYITNVAKIDAGNKKIREGLDSSTKNLLNSLANAERIEGMRSKSSEKMIEEAKQLSTSYRFHKDQQSSIVSLTEAELKNAQKLLRIYRSINSARSDNKNLTSRLREQGVRVSEGDLQSRLAANEADQEVAKGQKATRTEISRAEKEAERSRDNLSKIQKSVISSTRTISSVLGQIETAVTSKGALIAEKLGDMFRHIGAGLTFVSKSFNMLFNNVLRVFNFATIFTAIGSSIAALIGYGEEFDAFIKNIVNGIKAIFTNIERDNRKKAFYSLAAGALEELEKVDDRLKNIEEFKFTSKILWFEVEITKTKEDLKKDAQSLMEAAFAALEPLADQRAEFNTSLSQAMMQGSDTPNIFGPSAAGWDTYIEYLNYIQVPLSAVMNDSNLLYQTLNDLSNLKFDDRFFSVIQKQTQGLNDALASVAGQASNLQSVFLTTEQSQLADFLLGTRNSFGESSEQTKAAARLAIEQYQTAANLTLEGREYLRYLLQQLQVMDGQVTVASELQKIAEITGSSAYEMGKSFDVVIGDFFTTITRGLNTVRNGAIEVTKVADTITIGYLNDIANLSAPLFNNLRTLFPDIDFTNVEKAIINIETLATTINDLQDQTIRTDETLETFYSDFQSGTLDLEAIQQRWSEVQSIVDDLAIAISDSNSQVDAASNAYKQLEGVLGSNFPGMQSLLGLINQLKSGAAEATANTELMQQQIEDLRTTVENTIQALTMANRIMSDFASQVGRADFDFGTFRDTSGGSSFEIATNEAQKLEFTMERISNITAQNGALYDANIRRQESIHYFAQANNITREEEQKLLSATSDTIDDVITKLANGNTLLELQMRTQFRIGALNTEQLALVEETEAAYKAQIGFLLETVEAAQKFSDELEKQTKSLNEQLELQQLGVALEETKREIQLAQARNTALNDIAKELLEIEQRRIQLLDTQLQVRAQELTLTENAVARQQALSEATLRNENALNSVRKSSLELMLQINSAYRDINDSRINSELGSIDTNFDTRLRNAISQGESISNIMSDMNRVIQLQHEQAEIQMRAIRTEFALKKELIDLEHQETLASLDADEKRLKNERELLETRLTAIRSEARNQERIEIIRNGNALQEQLNNKANLDRELAINALKVEQANRQYIQEMDTIDMKTRADIAEAMQTKDELTSRYELLSAQGQVNNAFLNAFADMLTEARRLLEGPNAARITPQQAQTAYDDQMALMQDRLIEYARTRSALADAQVASLEEERATQVEILDLERQRIEASKAAIDQQIVLANQMNALQYQMRTAQTDDAIADIQNQLNIVDQQMQEVSRNRIAENNNYNRQMVEAYVSSLQQMINESENANALISSIPNTMREAVRDWVQEYKEQIKAIRRELQTMREENLLIRLRFEVDIRSLRRDNIRSAIEAEISRINLEIQLVEAKKDAKNISPVEAARQINDLHQQLLAQQKVLITQEYNNRKAAIADELRILQAEVQINQARIRADAEMQRVAVQNNSNYLKAMAVTYDNNITALNETNNNMLVAQAETYNSFLKGLQLVFQSVVTNLGNALSSIPGFEGAIGGFVSGASVTPGQAERGQQIINESLQQYGEASAEIMNAISERENMALKQEEIRLNQAVERARIEVEQARTERDRAVAEHQLNRAIEEQNAQSRLRDAAGGGGGGGGDNKAQEAIDDIMNTIHDAIQSLKSALLELAQSIVQTIGSTLIAHQQALLEAAEYAVEFVTDITTYISNHLSEVQSQLNDSLEKEKSLREQLLDQTKELTEAHKKYTDAFSFKDNNMVEASMEYLEKLWDQKETMLDLSQATRKSVALAKEEKNLIKTQIDQTEQLKKATEERNEAEAKLEKTQQMLDFASNMLSGSFTGLSQKLIEVGQTVAAVMQMMGMASDAGLSYTSPINSIFGQFSGTINDLSKTIAGLQGARASGGSVPSGFTGSASQYDSMLSSSGAIVGGLGGAMTGFGIGSAISQMVGDTGWATTIGGTVGGALAGFFAPQITTFLTGLAPTLMSGMLGSVIGIAIPIVGSIIGALLGSLFKKTPRMSASGTLSGGEFNIDRLAASGGAKMSSAKSAGNLMSDVFNNITSTLESVGIQFEGVVKASISAVKKNITASITMYGKTFKEGVAGGQEAAEFFMDQFFKNVRFEDLRFDELAQGISVIRTVVQKFTQDTEKSLRTAERFAEVIEYAQNFDKTIADLIGTGTSTIQVFEMIEKAAIANNYALAAYYRDGLAKAADFLGKNTSEYAEYTAAIRHNALAQIGLTEVIVNGEKQLISMSEAIKDLDTGAIAIRNIVGSISAMKDALREAGISNVSEVITKAINESLKDMTLAIRDNMQESLDILRDPAKAILPELRAITDNAKAMTRELTGQYDQILKEIEDGAQIQNGIVTTAWNSIILSQELGYEKTVAFLRGLSEAQLEAAVNSEILSGATQEMAEILLASARLISNQRAVSSLISSSKQMKEAIAGVTGVFLGIDWNGLIGIGPDFGTLAESLGGQNVDSLTANLGELINNVAAGRDVVNSFTSAGNLLIESYEDGIIKAENMANAFEHLTEVTTDYINSLQGLINQYEESLKKISDMLKNARLGVLQALEQLKETIVGSIQQTVTTSQTILKIFDDTLSGMAKSGNELFDLQDKARDSLAETTKAVLDFEEANQLSGKSVAQTTAELNDIAAQIALLSGMDPADFGLSEFLELSQLMSKQRFLQNELNTLSLVEGEYKQLLDKRTEAQEDLAFVEATILSLGDDLIDTRRQESDIIQKTQDAAAAFVKGQEDLLTITEMLAEANFDLNQARIDESDAVYKMAQALIQLSENMAIMEESFDFIIGDDFLTSIVETAVNNAKQLYSHLSDSELLPILDEVEISARNAAQGFIDMVESINSTIGGTDPNSGSIQVGTLTDRFKDFNLDLVKYLDSEGLALFYGPGGVFSEFRDALYSTMVLNGFGGLMMPGGPLENFNTYLNLTGKTIDDLVSSNAVLNLEFEKIETSLGPMIVALGETESKLSVISYAFAITGDALDSAQSGVENINTAFGNFAVSIHDGQMNRSLEIVSTSIPDSINTLHQNIFLLRATIEDLNISNSMGEAVTNVYTNFGLLETTLESINIANVVDNVGNVITSSFEDLGDNTTTSLQIFVDKFRSDIDDLSNPNSLTYFLYNLDLSGAISNATSTLDQVTISTVTAVDALIAVFSDNNNDKIRNVVESLTNLNSIVTTINGEEGLNAMLHEFDNITNDTARDISVLTQNAVSLRDTLSSLLGTDGTLTNIKDAFTNVAQDFADAWDTFRTNIDLTSPDFTVHSEVSLDAPALSTADKANLMQIATNTSIFPRISGATYDYITPSGTRAGYASGGLVEGPGSETSDSIPVNLSNGEFVINAQSTKALGTKVLDYLNSFGRRGDNMLAHINPQEAELLEMLGGSGTINPFTGLREYFTRDAGAVGNVFSKEEAALLWRTYGDKMLSRNPNGRYPTGWRSMEAESQIKNITKGFRSSWSWSNVNNFINGSELENLVIPWSRELSYLINEMQLARDNGLLTHMQQSFGINVKNFLGSVKRRQGNNFMTGNMSDGKKVSLNYPNIGTGPFSSNPGLSRVGDTRSRSNQMLNLIYGTKLGTGAINESSIKTAIEKANEKKIFTDFYMLQANNQARPSAQYLSTGGLVDRDFANSVMRDSVNAQLEPGEFVLKKPAVDKIGLAELYKLNATGDMGGDVNIEVNVENNGTNQQVVSYDARRREDGKIVVDVVLEDLRTNGPIARRIRTMRR